MSEDTCRACGEGEHDRCTGCPCIDMEHDADADADDGDTQWMDPGEAGGYEGAEW